ncbi:uncharacterized protein LOC141595436 [Silene latifolia]|uniref:uncharacterized protein LOC141595436 n=1 Tax=Silene latifolia TaxID=37657 RepID=UPI003D76C8D7
MNREKSDIYFNGLGMQTGNEVLNLSGFKEGQFPFRYLGIPISHKRMAIGDCSRLVEKIVMRIGNWGARKLDSVWIERICRNYLWSGGDQYVKSPPVSWENVCKAKKFGGLGMIDCRLWNVALIGKYVWWLVIKADHLWIKWVNHVYIKDQDWMHYQPTNNSSWTWRKICQVKEQMKAGFNNGRWDNQDHCSVAGGYAWLQGVQHKVNWWPLVWNRMNVHKHSFILWLAVQWRLMIKDRLIKFGIIADATCDMCMIQQEDHHHLLYGCQFSVQCWNLFRDWLKINMPLVGVLEWGVQWRCRSLLKKQMIMAAMAALVYQIWTVRNKCRIDLQLPRPCRVIAEVKANVRLLNLTTM